MSDVEVGSGVESSTSADVVSTLEELNPDAIMYDGFDAALLGIVARCSTEPLALYDREKCIKILTDRGLSWSDAEDYFCFNVEGCWAGPHTPFIASFNLDPVGVRYPVKDLEIVTEVGSATEILIGAHGTGDHGVDSAEAGSAVVDGAAPSGESVEVVESDEVATGAVGIDGE